MDLRKAVLCIESQLESASILLLSGSWLKATSLLLVWSKRVCSSAGLQPVMPL